MDTPYVSVQLQTARSTQDEARERFAGKPVLVTADRQTAGRGRSGNRWEQASRAVFASLALAPGWPPAALPRLTLAAGLAARDAAGGEVLLSWPNDLVRGEHKVGGLLAEASGVVVVVGLGLNLWWPDPMEWAAALYDADPGPAASAEAAARFAGSLLARAEMGPEAWGREEYLAVCATVGREITWEPGGRGRAVGVAGDGGLEVETGAGPVVLHAGAVRRVRPS